MTQKATTKPPTLIRDIMKAPVRTVSMDASLLDAKELFDRHRCHHLVVLEKRRVCGVLSDRDILRAASPFAGNRMMERSQDLTTLKKRVHQIMSRDLITAHPEDTVAEAAGTLLRQRVSCLPVVDDQCAPLGIVTIRDLAAWTVASSGGDVEGFSDDDHDEGILIIINGTRCYRPHREMARQIRAAERSFEKTNGYGLADPKCLPAADTMAVDRLGPPLPSPAS